MSHSTHMPDDVRSPGTQDVDESLTRYFRAALPEKWPACPQTQAERPAAALARFGTLQVYRRLAVAAAVAGLIVGYHALLGGVPDPQTSMRLEIDTSRSMGLKHLKPGEMLGSQPAKEGTTEPAKVTGKKE